MLRIMITVRIRVQIIYTVLVIKLHKLIVIDRALFKWKIQLLHGQSALNKRARSSESSSQGRKFIY